MGYEVVTFIAVAAGIWMFLKLIQNWFLFPRRLHKQLDIQQMLQDKVSNYEKYLEDCEQKERAAGMPSENTASTTVNGTRSESPSYEEKWKERREFLSMLKTELKRVRDGGDSYDWGNLLDDDDGDETKTENPKTESAAENASQPSEASTSTSTSTSVDSGVQCDESFLSKNKRKKNN